MNRMGVWLLALALPTGAGQALAIGLGDMAAVASAMGGAGSAQPAGVDTVALLKVLGQLNVTPQQALGGAGALLQVARHQLSDSDYAALAGAVPGLQRMTGADALNSLGGMGGLLGALGGQAGEAATVRAALDNVQTLQDAQQAFSALGMDAGLVGQFAPLLLQYLGSQGTAGPALQSLASAWGVSPPR